MFGVTDPDIKGVKVMLHEALLGLWKMAWFWGPMFGILIIGGIIEHFQDKEE
jgi:hypothetical protein